VGLFRNETGRVRLGWRILLFLLLAAMIAFWTAFFFPAGFPLGATPLLLGSVVAGWALLSAEGLSPGALGFYLAPSAGKEILLGLGLGVGVAGSVALIMVASGSLRWTVEAGSVLDYLREGATSLWLFTLPAASEEALMRGYFFQALAESWGGPWALGVTSALFGALHLGNPNTSWVGLANIVVAGLFLGVIYWKTASLWWATGAHLGWNWAHGFLADLPVSGLELIDAPMLEPVTRGPEWVTGGAFGPEGSLVATGVLALATIWIWKASWIGPGQKAREVRPLILAGMAQGFRAEQSRGALETP
jgi:membrane protease YdiL (CAAX protease family)